MVSLNEVPNVVMLLVISGMVLGAGALALSQFSGTLTAASTEKLAVANATLGLGNLAAQLPTVGTIIGVAIILVVVLAAFSYGRGKV